MKQIIYRMKLDGVPELPAPIGFWYVRSVGQCFRHYASFRDCFGFVGALLVFAKVFTAKRALYGITRDRKIVHYGWLSHGFCRYYSVEKNSTVIGPIWTYREYRGHGYATQALQSVLVLLSNAHREYVYIDTAENNIACLRVIGHCAFGVPFGSCDRVKDGG